MKSRPLAGQEFAPVVLLIVGIAVTACDVTHTMIAFDGSDSGVETDVGANDTGGEVGLIHVDPQDGPGLEPGIECELPSPDCVGDESYCGELIQFDPSEGVGYVDYPENGESEASQERSFYRRDLVLLVKYAAAYVACKTANWDFGNGGRIGVIDGSTETGANPGGYWEGTHLGGMDLTVAYYQVNTADNRARAVCEHMENGEEMSRCIGEPIRLDPFRTALFVGALSHHPSLRVVGCDGKVGPQVQDALERLCQNSWLNGSGCQNFKLAWEEIDTGAGWYYSHHHHMQISMDNS